MIEDSRLRNITKATSAASFVIFSSMQQVAKSPKYLQQNVNLNYRIQKQSSIVEVSNKYNKNIYQRKY